MKTGAAQIDVRPASRMLKALGDETRLRIIALLAHGELCVCHLESALGLNQSNASRQLAVLRNAGVVEPRRQGNWMFYRLATQLDALCRDQLKALVRYFSQQEVLRKDVERLLKAKGPGACP
jgi:ArsR family transcriptional regulator